MLTSAAFSLAITMSTVFTVFYFSQAHTAYQHSAYESGAEIADITRLALATGNLPSLQDEIALILENRATVHDSSGNLIIGKLDPQLVKTSFEYPLAHKGETLGTLTYAPGFAYVRPIPIWLAALICLALSGIAALVMRTFARAVGEAVGQATRMIGDYSLVGTGRRRVTDFTFSEFRQLALETTRATRRVSKELEHLRASTRIDERTGLLTERAFLEEVRGAIQTLSPTDHAVLITIEFEPQQHGSEATNLSLPTEAHVEVADRLKVFTNQAALKHGHKPANWMLGSLFAEKYALLIKEHVTRDEVAGIIRELLGEFRVPLRLNQQSVQVAQRGSIVLMPQDGDVLNKVMDRALATIEDLQRKARTGFAFYSPKLERQRAAKLKLEAELRQEVILLLTNVLPAKRRHENWPHFRRRGARPLAAGKWSSGVAVCVYRARRRDRTDQPDWRADHAQSLHRNRQMGRFRLCDQSRCQRLAAPV